MTRNKKLKPRSKPLVQPEAVLCASPGLDMTALWFFDALYWFRTYVAPNVRPDIWPLKPLNLDDSIPWLMLPPFFQRLCAVSFQSWTYSFFRVHPSGQSELLKQRGVCVQELRDLLEDTDIDRSRVALTSALMFLESDLNLETTDWRIHYDACTKFLSTEGGFKARLIEPNPRNLMIRFMLMDIFSSTTVPSSALITRSFIMYQDYFELLPQLEAEIIAHHTPCPAKILSAVALTNLLRSTSPSSLFVETSSKYHIRRSHILEMLLNFDPATWAASIANPDLPLSAHLLEQTASNLSALADLAQSYKSAAILYLIFSYPIARSSDDHPDSTTSPSDEDHILLTNLSTLSRFNAQILTSAGPAHDTRLESHTWSFLAWPLFISAYTSIILPSPNNARDDLQEHTSSISQLEIFAEKYGTLRAKEAAKILRDLDTNYRREVEEGDVREWGGHFDGNFRFVV